MIAKGIGAGIVIMASALFALFWLVAVAVAAASARGAAAGHATLNPSQEAVDDIPPGLIEVYTAAAAPCAGLPWQTLAAIAKVESNHGRHGNATIADTDDGRFDGDVVWDRAVGPFQFIPSSWMIFGQDANNDGVRDPHNILDATAAAVAHLCPAGELLDLEAAIFAYNHSHDYVDTVLDWTRRYTGTLSTLGTVTEGYAFPLPPAYATQPVATRPHRDYPAIDLAAPPGTPAYSMVAGTVSTAVSNAGVYMPGSAGRCGNTIVINGVDGATYTYCHLSAVLVAARSTRSGRLPRRPHRRYPWNTMRGQHHRPTPPPWYPRLRTVGLPSTTPARSRARSGAAPNCSPHDRLHITGPQHQLEFVGR